MEQKEKFITTIYTDEETGDSKFGTLKIAMSGSGTAIQYIYCILLFPLKS